MTPSSSPAQSSSSCSAASSPSTLVHKSAAPSTPSTAAAQHSIDDPPDGKRKRVRKRCTHDGCTKVDAGGGFCVAHGGGKKCLFPGCTKGYQTGGFCRQHGGGARCQIEGCGKVDAGRGLCRRHGGGRRCQQAGCHKADVGGGFCTAHGGGKRCAVPGCNKVDQGGGHCRAHGGAKRCRKHGCSRPARGTAGLCSQHGGAPVCSTPNCRRLARESRLPGAIAPLCTMCAREQHSEGRVTDDGLSAGEYASPPSSFLALHLELPPPTALPASVAISEATTTTTTTSTFVKLQTATARTAAAACCAGGQPDTRGDGASRKAGGCSGSNMASCLENGCARSFGGQCNCRDGCGCCGKAAVAAAAVEAPAQTPSLDECNSIDTAPATPPTAAPAPPPSTPVSNLTLLRVVLRLERHASLPLDEMVSICRVLPNVRSAHVVDEPSSASPSARSTATVVVRCEQGSRASILSRLEALGIRVSEPSDTTHVRWSYKEVVLKVEEMMCPGNCGATVISAMRRVDHVTTANLLFETRTVVARGHMSVDALCDAVSAIGFDPVVVAITPLPRRFRFRVQDLASLHTSGHRLAALLRDVEGVESVFVVIERAEVLVAATLVDASSILQAATAQDFVMVEIPDETGDVPRPSRDVDSGAKAPSLSSTPETPSSAAEPATPADHICDVNVCPRVGCQQYMATVAHTAALAVGWVVPGCAMSWGGECTCGEGCKCVGCPKHNPVS
ncbi:hypothetical protein ATCC90586_008336 [Pythium insidiosum]|nr:hypothetical protein ATCC90586_008336 [Pythium insidiosum]